MPLQRVLAHYAIQSLFSTPGRQAALFDALQSDAAGIARAVQGLLIYKHVAKPFYGCALSETRRAESHLRLAERIIDTLRVLDDHPLTISRPPEKRLVGICRHFMLGQGQITRDRRSAPTLNSPPSSAAKCGGSVPPAVAHPL
jgi:hypothetical protein